ncbi:NAD-dependent malic enzyme [Nocardia sp. CDC159]|uniref:NAD-dependent malic enzyme n=1 Tax=Nocardia pulmonis TaxID=2951408 RepID=A0A9X2J0Y4_9NOCA|nr:MULTISPECIES: malic enzyme-like NAD(P)-binding protein [Nocardia]MCM6779063.1 NAD-dependent malic enzyme [Nocardia pulmonis]MCM6791953.1 NAD-dependent malic enzyme [Nocardia sp. CDC159]
MSKAIAATEIADEEILEFHRGGKLVVAPTAPLLDSRTLSVSYTPGVARVSTAIAQRPELVDTYTWAARMIAVVTDGTAVLGLGDVGPRAALPVMEGKAGIFRAFAELNAVPLVLDTTDVDEIVRLLRQLRPSFGAVSLEDVAAPRCFELERRLIEELDCPVMHDDQHGTAIVTLAGLRGAATLLGQELTRLRVVVAGAGAAGIACARLLLAAGVTDITLVDSRGIVHAERTDLNPVKAELARRTNIRGLRGGIEQALPGANVLIGVSSSRIPEELVAAMAPDAVIFALSNPEPEIDPAVAARHAAIVGTGRSDHPNQINNILASPGIFRGALDAGARRITEAMKLAATAAIAEIAAEDLAPDRVVPSAIDPRVTPAVAAAVAAAATR